MLIYEINVDTKPAPILQVMFVEFISSAKSLFSKDDIGEVGQTTDVDRKDTDVDVVVKLLLELFSLKESRLVKIGNAQIVDVVDGNCIAGLVCIDTLEGLFTQHVELGEPNDERLSIFRILPSDCESDPFSIS